MSDLFLKEMAQESLLTNIASDQLENELNVLECQFWELSSKEMELNKSLQELKQEYKNLQYENKTLSAQVKLFNKETLFWDKKIAEKKLLHQQLLEKEREQTKLFNQNIADITTKYQNFITMFNDKNNKEEIAKLTEETKILEATLKKSQEELQIAKEKLLHVPNFELPNLKDLIKTLEDESVKLYGDPNINRKKFTELKASITYLENKLKELEEK